MALDKATVAKVAHLARIRMTEAELEPMAEELNRILAWVEQLGELDTADVPPMTSATAQGLRWRPDVVTEGGDPERVLANAPAGAGGFFAVPKVVE
jgi:aspartyl-tRNA(Asn)/glutamyl-tRNA(Gln) amidotransferase subunit C